MVTLQLVPYDSVTGRPLSYEVDFTGEQRRRAGILYREGNYGLSGPVAQKVAVGDGAKARLERELHVARYLRGVGGELISKCLAYDFAGSQAATLVSYRGQPLADHAKKAGWPLDHRLRVKLTADLLQGLEALRVHSIVHGAIGMDTVFWDGKSSLQITDFGHAALRGKYPDGRTAEHGDDVTGACRVIYEVNAGQSPPADPFELRRQLEEVQDDWLRDLLLYRKLGADRDVYYAFDAEPEQRPTSRDLLDRLEWLDGRRHGPQRKQLQEEDRRIRAGFRRLREQQREFQGAYRAWTASQTAGPASPSPPPGPRPAAQQAEPPRLELQPVAYAVPPRPTFTLRTSQLAPEVGDPPPPPPAPVAPVGWPPGRDEPKYEPWHGPGYGGPGGSGRRQRPFRRGGSRPLLVTSAVIALAGVLAVLVVLGLL